MIIILTQKQIFFYKYFLNHKNFHNYINEKLKIKKCVFIIYNLFNKLHSKKKIYFEIYHFIIKILESNFLFLFFKWNIYIL